MAEESRGDFTEYTLAARGAEESYPYWCGEQGTPNLQTFLDAINKSNPILQCQFEIVWSRWPRTIFFAKGINIPGL